MLATSTREGHSVLQALHPTQRSMTSFMRRPVSSSGGRVPSITDLSMLALALVVSCSSRVTMYEGHIVPPVLLRQKPLPLHSSTAFAKPPWSSKERFDFMGRRLRPGPIRSCRSIGGGFMITPGFISPSGSKRRLTSAKARRISPPYIFSINSERERPSPCSPEMDPPQLTTRSATSSAMRRIRETPSGSEVSRAGLTCRHPTLAWPRSEEHTSELQSHSDLVCRLL